MLGPNGAGKTTTIRMLTGLLRPTAGVVRVCGHDLVRNVQHATRMIGYVPEEPFLYDKLSGPRVPGVCLRVARGLTVRRVNKSSNESAKISIYWTSSMTLTETYSHGMKQRLVFASALMHDPPVLVIDEPMVGLDPRSCARRQGSVADAGGRRAPRFSCPRTRLAVAEEITHRIGIMAHGRLHFLGTVSELQRELASPHTSLEPLFLEVTEGGNVQDDSDDHTGSNANGHKSPEIVQTPSFPFPQSTH